MKQLVIKIFVLLLIFSLFLSSHSVAEGDDHDHGHHEEESRLHINDETLREFGVKVVTAKKGQIKKIALFPGEVGIHLDHLAHVTPRFPGVVKKIYPSIGDKVKKGEVLAVIESNDSLTPYKIRAPIAGTVIEKHVTIGESLEANSRAFDIANLDVVWITFSIFQDKIGDIVKGQKAMVRFNGKYQAEGTVSYISPVVDPHTRTQIGRIVLSNKNHHWKPGMFVDVRVVFSRVRGKVVVPNTAIQRIDNGTFIFIREEGAFEPHLVQLGASDKTFVIVESGIQPGTSYVSEGGFILKAELEKGSMGHGHSH